VLSEDEDAVHHWPDTRGIPALARLPEKRRANDPRVVFVPVPLEQHPKIVRVYDVEYAGEVAKNFPGGART